MYPSRRHSRQTTTSCASDGIRCPSKRLHQVSDLVPTKGQGQGSHRGSSRRVERHFHQVCLPREGLWPRRVFGEGQRRSLLYDIITRMLIRTVFSTPAEEARSRPPSRPRVRPSKKWRMSAPQLWTNRRNSANLQHRRAFSRERQEYNDPGRRKLRRP